MVLEAKKVQKRWVTRGVPVLLTLHSNLRVFLFSVRHWQLSLKLVSPVVPAVARGYFAPLDLNFAAWEAEALEHNTTYLYVAGTRSTQFAPLLLCGT